MTTFCYNLTGPLKNSTRTRSKKIKKTSIDSSEELHKNPSEDVQQEEDENLAPIPPRQIPELLIARTVALVRRCHYPKLSLISRAFLRVISSPELYRRHSVLGLTEPVLYALIGFPYSHESFRSWHILNLNISESLSEVPSLPPMYPGSSVVTIGYNMYVIGGLTGLNQPVSTVFVLECRFHTWDHLPSMHRARYRAAAGVIDRKIYVIGGLPYLRYSVCKIANVGGKLMVLAT
ncbi:PREDICTED: putative F-box/kelch-repeat protein At2g29780 [Camelina sativa]|uniref:F-box/kelch-repeat protein At2g29780 n=1 Tax=Camelina sativa TaxID=90675 RepID=A0ABM0T097_CAMSA|nr:PREDICTED: putative F-box/kelch-repeat protein At2g29780 [Camelina sativa]